MIVALCLVMVASALRLEQLKGVKLINVQRNVNLAQRYVESRTKVSIFTLFNDGIQTVQKYFHTVPKEYSNYLFHISLEDGSETLIGKRVNDLEALSRYNVTVFEFTLKRQVSEKSKRTFTLSEQYYNRFSLLPKKITLTEDQLVVFEDDVLFYTPYHVENQQSHFETKRLISYEPTSDAVERGRMLEYPVYKDIQPFTSIPLRIHAENNNPLVVFKSVKKSIEVSHWGNIGILEEYALYNRGANLTGEFGRVVYNKYNSNSGKNALKDMTAILPYQTWGIYYRDEIGNISTSNAIRGNVRGENSVKLDIRPRFPILGGWRSNFQIGYNLPTQTTLQVAAEDPELHQLTQDFIFSVDDIICEDYELEVILPEGASEIVHNLGDLVDSQSETLTFSYLDITGRPTLIFKKRLVSDHLHHQIKIQYRFASVSIFREPLMIFVSYLIFFMSLVGLGRLDLVTLRLKKD